MRKNNKLMRKILWRLFPNTMYIVWSQAIQIGTQDGIEKGREAQRQFIEQQIRKHDLTDFDDPSLTLGYTHAVKAIQGHLRDVA